MTKTTSQEMLELRTKANSEDLKACRKLIRHGSHSFFMASLVLPKRTAIPATALYAFCRIADDLIDNDQGGDDAIQALSKRLDAIYAGTPESFPEDRAMSEVVHHFNIPRSMLDALIEGLSWDVKPREYQTLSDVYQYAARVAGCVGSMMSLIMGTTDKQTVARACDLGVAMQLTNIARDIGEDARMGRLYLPIQWFDECGLDAQQWLANPYQDERISQMCQRLLDYAHTLYQRADSGITKLPLACRPGIRAARLIYAEIGAEIRRKHYQIIDDRAVVPVWRKTTLLLWAPLSISLKTTAAEQDLLEWPPLHETQFLLTDLKPVTKFDRVEWLFALFESLQSREDIKTMSSAPARRKYESQTV